MTYKNDLEKGASLSPDVSSTDIQIVEPENNASRNSFWRRLSQLGVEVRGIGPIPLEERIKTNYNNIFFMWLSILCNLLPIVTGMAGTLGFGLGLRDTSLVIIFFNLLCCIMTAYIGTLGPKTGMRQIVQARYSFGLYSVSVIAILNLIAVVGFTLIAVVIGGQTLAAVSNGKMTITVGIVLTAILGLVISFCGYRVLHLFNKYSWLVTMICVVICVGCGGKHLNKPVYMEPATAPMILTYGCLIAGFMLPFAGIMSDFAVYYSPSAPPKRMFWYVYFGQLLPTVLLMILGAAIGSVVPNVESWNTAYEAYSAGGVLEAMLHPAGGFGKFVAVLLAFSLMGNIGASMYSITLNFQATITYAALVPRAVYAVITTAILIPVGIKTAESFFYSLESFLGVVSYWPGVFSMIVIIEHLYFRKGDAATYDQTIWKNGKKLPPGLAAIGTGILAFGIIIPCMSTTWFTGPIGKLTGDIGFEVGIAITPFLYFPLRTLEIKLSGHL